MGNIYRGYRDFKKDVMGNMKDKINNANLTRANFPRVAIIILNWNGWRDTIEWCQGQPLVISLP